MNLDFGLLLWTGENSGLPTGPLTITQNLKIFLFIDDVVLGQVGLPCVLPLAVHLDTKVTWSLMAHNILT